MSMSSKLKQIGADPKCPRAEGEQNSSRSDFRIEQNSFSGEQKPGVLSSVGLSAGLRVVVRATEGTTTTVAWSTVALGILRWCFDHLRDVWGQDLGARKPHNYQNGHHIWCSVGLSSGLSVVARAIEGTRTTVKWSTMAVGIMRWCLDHLRDVWGQDLGARTPHDYQNGHHIWCSVVSQLGP